MYHLHVKQIRKASGGSTLKTAQYISRTGKSKTRGDVVREVMNFNMPSWVENTDSQCYPQSCSQNYWSEADTGSSRVNALSAYTIEMALPKVLPHPEQRTLVLAFAQNLSRLCAENLTPSAAVPMSLAIHEGYGNNPHFHMLVSPSIHDGIERSPALWFMRYNPKKPGNGGAKRSRYMGKKNWLFKVREMWANLANQALQMAGLEPTMDHRSHAARGLIRAPSLHLGPSAAHLLRQNKPAPRVQRYRALQEEEKALDEQRQNIERTRRNILLLEGQEQSDRHARLVWHDDEARSMQMILGQHPFAGDIAIASQSFCVLVAGGSSSIVKASRGASVTREIFRKLRLELPSPWLFVEDQTGLWLTRPNLDEVIRVGPTHVVSDAVDSDALEIILRIAKLLPLDKPVVHAQEELCQSLRARIRQLKEDWSVRSFSNLPKPAEPSPLLKRLRP